MKIKEAKIGKKCLYRGHITTIKNIRKEGKRNIILNNGYKVSPLVLQSV